jgi:hypothetical protein
MANYYVKNGGNDGADGLSDGNAWATISKVNGFSFASGDTISFKCSSYWRETLTVPRSGTLGGYMIFNSYSTGNNPKIIGSNTTTWTNYSGNVWVSASTFTDPNSLGYGCEIWFENLDTTVSWGLRKAAIVNLAAEYDYTWVSNYIYVYSTTDPDTAYSKVEIPQRRNCISLNSKNYIKIDYVDLHYAEVGVCGEYPVMGYTGLYVGHAEMSYFGIPLGGENDPGYSINVCYNDALFEHNIIHDCGRRGISYYLYGDANISNIIVQYNEFYHNFHTTGFDCTAGSQSTDDGDLSNITIRNNFIWEDIDNDGPSTEWIWLQGKREGTGVLSDVYIYNNIMKYSNNHGIGVAGVTGLDIFNNTFYGHCTEVPTNTFHISISPSDGGATSTDIVIKNNIFYTLLNYGTEGAGCLIHLGTGQSWTGIVADYNIYYRINNGLRIIIAETGGDEYYMDEYSLLRSEHPTWEEHGYFDNPDLTSSTDYHLLLGSPAIWTGVYLADVLTDYEGNPRHNPPSIGAYEYGSDVTIGLPKIHNWSTV